MTFANPDGTWTTEISAAPIHYRNPQIEDAWLPIETGLVPTQRPGFVAQNAANSFKLLIADDAGQGPVRLEDAAGGWLEFRLLGQDGLPEVAGRAAEVSNGPGLSSVRYESTPTGVKEFITLPALPAQPPVFTSELRLSAGLTPVLVDNQVVVSDAEGDERFRVPAPFMEDAAGVSTSAVTLGLSEQGAGWRLTVTPDYGWLSDPARVFPVMVDPTTTTTSVDVRDTYMSAESPSETFDTNTRIRAGTDAGAGTQRRGLLRIEIPTVQPGSEPGIPPGQSWPVIPTYATVDTATLRLYLATVSQPGSVDVGVRAMTTGWNNNAKWNGSGTGTAWTGASGFFFVNGPTLPVNQSKEGTWIDFNVKSHVAPWVAGTDANQGWLIKTDPDVEGSRTVAFHSSDGAFVPRVVVTWRTDPPTVVANSLTLGTPSVISGGDLVARSLTPELKAQVSDDSRALRYSVEVLDAAGNPISAAGSGEQTITNTSPGSPISLAWRVPAGVLQPSTSYTMRVRVADESTTAPIEATRAFQVDLPPTAPTVLAVDPCSVCTGSPLETPDLRPTLSAALASDDSGSLDAVFEVQKVSDSSVVARGRVLVAAGERAAYRVPAAALVDLGSYRFRVGADDGVDPGGDAGIVWSGWQTFNVDRSARVYNGVSFLDDPAVVYSEGAELRWAPYLNEADDPKLELLEYQVYRLPCTPAAGGTGCAGTPPAPGSAQPIGTVPADTLSFRDTTATPSRTGTTTGYWYLVRPVRVDEGVSGPVFSNARGVVMPRAGRVRRIYTGDLPDTTLSAATPTTGQPGSLQTGTAHTGFGRQHALIKFDVTGIEQSLREAGLVVTDARIELSAKGGGATAGSPVPQGYSIHPLTRGYDENQASWAAAATGSAWTAAGGDFNAAVNLGQATLTPPNRPITPQQRVTFTGAGLPARVTDWAESPTSNLGILIKATDEAASAPQQWVDWTPSESTAVDAGFVGHAPRLVVEHLATPAGEEIRAPQMPERFLRNSQSTIPVTVTNTTTSMWQTAGGGAWSVGSRWTADRDVPLSGTQPYDEISGSPVNSVSLGQPLAPGESVTVELPLEVPATNNSVGAPDKFDLWLDLTDDDGQTWLSQTQPGLYPTPESGRPAVDATKSECVMQPEGLRCTTRVVESAPSNELGLEQYATYAGEGTGAGSQITTNLHNGNLVWNYDAFSVPAVGPDAFFRMTYNSLDTNTTAPIGLGWSVQAGALTRLGSVLDIPSSSTGSTPDKVTLVDGDGTSHEFFKEPGSQTRYQIPAGLDLTLQTFPNRTNPDARWVLTQPDGTQFYYRQESGSGNASTGRPSMVADVNGNTLVFDYDDTPGGDPQQLQSVSDSAGVDVLSLQYYPNGLLAVVEGPANTTVPTTRRLVLGYNAQGLLRSLQDGRPTLPALDSDLGPDSCASATTIKCFAFNYRPYNSNNPDPWAPDNADTSTNQRLMSITDPKGAVTKVAYYDSGDTYRDGSAVPSWVNGWVAAYQDRGAQVTSVEYRGGDAASSRTVVADVHDARVLGVDAATRRVTATGAVFPGDQTRYRVDGYGRMVAMRDANANDALAPTPSLLRDPQTTRLVWDDEHNITALTEPNGARSTWAYDPGTHIPTEQRDAQAVADGTAGSTLTLDTATVAIPTLAFPTGSSEAVSVAVRRVRTATDPHGVGHATAFNYTGTNPALLTQIVSPLGHTTRFGYHPDGTLKSETDPRGDATATTFTTNYAYTVPAGARKTGFPTTVTPPLDAATTLAYDAMGAVTQSSQTGAGQTVTTSVVYDVFGRPTQVTAPPAQTAARITTTVYDVNDNVTSETITGQAGTPNSVTAWDYLPDDQVRTQTLPGNGNAGPRVVRYAYDPTGAPARVMSPLAAPTTSAPAARETSIAPLPTSPSSMVDRVTYFQHDRIGQVTAEATRAPDETGVLRAATTRYSYDEVGNLTTLIDPKKDLTTASDYTTRTLYDLAHRPVAVIDALGHTTRTVYDPAGLVERTLDQRGTPTTYTYDRDDRLATMAVRHQDGPAGTWTTSYGYDKAGNRITVTRPDAKVETTSFDARNRVLETISAAGGTHQAVHAFFDYDALGRMTRQYLPTYQTTKPAVSEATELAYYRSGEIERSTDPWGITTRYEYDQLGNQTRRVLAGQGGDTISGDASRTMTWTYHADGSQASRSDAPAPAVALVDNDANTDTGDDQATKTGSWATPTPTGTTLAVGPDYLTSSGTATLTWKLTPTRTGTHTVAVSCPKAGTQTANYTITHQGSPTSGSLNQGTCTATQRWYTVGTRTLTADQPLTVKLTAGAAGVLADAVRIVHAPTTAPKSKTYTYAYDLDGQQTQVTDTSVRDAGDSYPVRSYRTGYDQLGRATSVTETDAISGGTALRTTGYTYDLAGNTTKVTATRNPRSEGTDTVPAHTRTTDYAWDARNLLTRVTATTASNNTAARSWDYTYDPRGLVTSWRKPGNAAGSPNGNLTRFTYYDNQLLKRSVERTPGDVLVASHILTYHPTGDRATDHSVLRNAEAAGDRWIRQDATYGYTPNRRLETVTKTRNGAGEDESYSYDAPGNITSQDIGNTVTGYTYRRNRLLTSTRTTGGVAAPITRHHYDPYGRATTTIQNGTLTSRYTYDGFDRITGRYTFDGTATSQTTTYDPLDRPVAKTTTTGGTTKTTRFAYLGLSKQVAAEQKKNGTAWVNTKAFTYAPNGKPLALHSTPIGGTPTTRYYSLNPHGDTEALTNPDTGLPTATYRYNSYGTPDKAGTTGDDKLDPNGDPPEEPVNPLQYQAQWFDTATGSYDTGFRTYDTGLNRFTSRDMYDGALADFNLGTDPWNSNRYTFTGGNPISFTDLDGHIAIEDDGTRHAGEKDDRLTDPNPSAGATNDTPNGQAGAGGEWDGWDDVSRVLGGTTLGTGIALTKTALDTTLNVVNTAGKHAGFMGRLPSVLRYLSKTGILARRAAALHRAQRWLDVASRKVAPHANAIRGGGVALTAVAVTATYAKYRSEPGSTRTRAAIKTALVTAGTLAPAAAGGFLCAPSVVGSAACATLAGAGGAKVSQTVVEQADPAINWTADGIDWLAAEGRDAVQDAWVRGHRWW